MGHRESGKRVKKLLIKSLPYIRDWLNGGKHPTPENPNAYIFCGSGGRNRGRKLERHTFSHRYVYYRKYLFPKLLGSPDVSDEDKKIIKEKIVTKPIKSYVLRHTSLTDKAQLIGEYELRLHADRTTSSPMPQHYLHFGGNESITALMKAQGIISTDNESSDDGKAGESLALKPALICLNCREPTNQKANFALIPSVE